ncbi:MAG TPA: GNAT family N-acetyltransferase [Chthonomonadaceae bacterium]|nr:GNAT family N-acetyltransferase [Chthonomonadaceae bacterium]
MGFEARAIREEEREECLALWCEVWPGEHSRAYFERYFYGDVEWLPYYTQVGVLDGKLVSAVHICKRTVACGDFRLTMGGIANVATLPEHRGHGYNTACLERAIGVMEADAMDFSLLGTGINGYYARLGFSTLPWPRLEGTVRPGFTPRPTAYMLRPATADDLPAIREIYAAYNRQRPVAVQRTEAYWRDWIRFPDRMPKETLWMALHGADWAVGYVWYTWQGDHANFEELAVSGPETWAEGEDPTVALLEAAAGDALRSGQPQLRAGIAFTPVAVAAFSRILEKPEWRNDTHGMARLLHRENLLKSVAIGLNDRWIAAGRPRGTLTFETPYGPIRLDAEGDFLQVETTPEGARALPQETLFGLLLGLLAPEQAMDDPALHPLLATLFPPGAPVFWPADGF